MECALTADLLPRGDDENRAASALQLLGHVTDSRDESCYAAFHVRRAAAEHLALDNLAPKRIDSPGRVSKRNRIDVACKAQRRLAAATSYPCNQISSIRGKILDRRLQSGSSKDVFQVPNTAQLIAGRIDGIEANKLAGEFDGINPHDVAGSDLCRLYPMVHLQTTDSAGSLVKGTGKGWRNPIVIAGVPSLCLVQFANAQRSSLPKERSAVAASISGQDVDVTQLLLDLLDARYCNMKTAMMLLWFALRPKPIRWYALWSWKT
jgi:hypothetical protein